MPTRTPAPNAPQLFLWRGQSLVIGTDTDSRMHSHFAAQLSWGIDGPFRARLAADLDWQTCRAAIFAPNQMHQIDCGGQALAHIFIELPQRQQTDITCLNAPYADAPGFASVRAAIALAQDGALGIAGAQQALHDWFTCALPAHTAHTAHATSVTPDTPTTPHPPARFERRIARALDWIAAHPAEQPDGAQLAAAVHLSPSRFTHLFRQQTGLSLSRYLLWSRLLAAIDAIAHGVNLTQAAHQANFADLAHMSRSFRATFGVTPSDMLKMTIAFKREVI